MKIGQAYPSDFLKADDLGGKEVTVTIASCEFESIGQGHDKEQKLILSFVGKSKRMVLNKTNARTVAKLYGDETDMWPGKRIAIAAKEVEFQGDQVWALRVSLKAPAPAGVPLPPPPPVVADDEGDGVVPF